MEYVLAIDQGTTGSRAFIFDSRGHVRATAYQEFKQYYPKPGWVEHDPEAIWQSARRVRLMGGAWTPLLTVSEMVV